MLLAVFFFFQFLYYSYKELYCLWCSLSSLQWPYCTWCYFLIPCRRASHNIPILIYTFVVFISFIYCTIWLLQFLIRVVAHYIRCPILLQRYSCRVKKERKIEKALLKHVSTPWMFMIIVLSWFFFLIVKLLINAGWDISFLFLKGESSVFLFPFNSFLSKCCIDTLNPSLLGVIPMQTPSDTVASMQKGIWKTLISQA